VISVNYKWKVFSTQIGGYMIPKTSGIESERIYIYQAVFNRFLLLEGVVYEKMIFIIFFLTFIVKHLTFVSYFLIFESICEWIGFPF